jgi:hypothetical protein
MSQSAGQLRAYQLRIKIAGGIVVQTLYSGAKNAPLDTPVPATQGKFGLLIPNNDEVWIANFDLAPDTY